MNKAQRQVIAEKISSTVRVLELLGLSYEVRAPKNKREKGNSSPRVCFQLFGSCYRKRGCGIEPPADEYYGLCWHEGHPSLFGVSSTP